MLKIHGIKVVHMDPCGSKWILLDKLSDSAANYYAWHNRLPMNRTIAFMYALILIFKWTSFTLWNCFLSKIIIKEVTFYIEVSVSLKLVMCEAYLISLLLGMKIYQWHNYSRAKLDNVPIKKIIFARTFLKKFPKIHF